MDFCRNVSVSGGLPSEYPPEQVLSPCCSKLGSLDDLFSCHKTEGDVSLEWLSIFVEECLSSTGNCLPLAPTNNENTSSAAAPEAQVSKPLQLQKPQTTNTCSQLQKFVIPGKARSKRKRGPTAKPKIPTSWSHHLNPQDCSDPPLLQQAYWLADSELIFPKKEDTDEDSSRDRDGEQEGTKEEVVVEEEKGMGVMPMVGKDSSCLEGSNGQQQPRRCTHCLAQRTPQWRAGPLGPKTLCNACGVRYKSGRLLPEYRPAKSPTFVSYKHSNSHKKVMEMRMALLSSIPTPQH
ncbi:hypothetical protein F0562_016547 [Nyssa sinensis]|uniref:GATA-type domain-containing protein n=1 Tax=Nyssa sinensis TaxID=561372 RepID=A0A5J4ZEK3_9ASTE|nr:hypothetical protein F0562_016547 [Nyssa sinensis]